MLFVVTGDLDNQLQGRISIADWLSLTRADNMIIQKGVSRNQHCPRYRNQNVSR
jgi:hypothetical protein